MASVQMRVTPRDGTGYLGGARGRGRNAMIHWTKWTAMTALGTGYDRINNWVPFCAAGRYAGYRVKIEL